MAHTAFREPYMQAGLRTNSCIQICLHKLKNTVQLIAYEDYDNPDKAFSDAVLAIRLHDEVDLKPDTHSSYEYFGQGYGAQDVTKNIKTCKYCGKRKLLGCVTLHNINR